MLRRTLKYIYAFYLIVIWVLVICLSIELGWRIIFKTANFLYKPLFERQNAKVYRVVKLTDELKVRSPERSKTPEIEFITVHFENRNNKIANEVTDNVCNKNYELTLQGIAEIHFDGQGNIKCSYGDPVIERYVVNLAEGLPVVYHDLSWKTLLHTIKQSTSSSYSIRLKYEWFYVHHYQVDVSRQDGETIMVIKEIRDAYPLSLKPRGTILSEDSPWLVPFFSYKSNWKKENNIAQYNNLGFRDDDVIIPKPKNIFRIVCVGGSTTEEGNSNDMSYPNIMERKLRRYFHTENIDVINAGICGIRSFGEVRRIDDYLNLQPDMLIYYNAINDICYHYIPFWLKIPNPSRKIIQSSAVLTRIFNRKLLPPDDYIVEYFQKTIFRNLGAMNCACKKKGVQMAICSFAYPKIPWYNFIARLYCDFNIRNVWLSQDEMITFDTYVKIIQIYNRELKNFCDQEGILYIPVAEEFNAKLDHFSDVCHMTPLGLDVKTDIIGSHVARWIEENKLK